VTGIDVFGRAATTASSARSSSIISARADPIGAITGWHMGSNAGYGLWLSRTWYTSRGSWNLLLVRGRSDCPLTVISKHLAVFLNALQCRLGSLGNIVDRLTDLGCRLAGERQFPQDHFVYRPTRAAPRRFFALRICPGIAGSNFANQHLYGR
jgi:hypothetical protein